MKQKLSTILAVSAIVVLASPIRGQATPAKKLEYRHAYYLFLVGLPNGCEDCYVPLLITQEPLEQIAKGKSVADCVWIITYERDSVWENKGIVNVLPEDVSPMERKLRTKGRTYRYQEIHATEVIHLLANPMGTIPISRIMLPLPPKGAPSLEELLSEFKDLK